MKIEFKINPWLTSTKKYYIILTTIFLLFFGSLAFFYRNVSPKGDELHYLLMSHNIIKYHNIWMEKSYSNKDYYIYYQGPLDHETYLGLGNHEYIVHGILYPFLILPAFFLGGKLGVSFFTAILSTLLMIQIFRYCLKVTLSEKLSFLITLAIGFCLPIANFSILAFTDILGALLLLTMFMEFLENNNHLFIVFGVILPWINIRFLPVTGLISLLFFLKKRRLPVLLPIISGILYFIFLKITSGSFNPWPILEPVNASLGSGNILFNFINTLIDRQYGLFIYSPIYILAIPGFYFWYKKNKESVILTLFFTVVFLIPVLWVGDWQGGFTPPGRYVLGVLPLWIPSLIYFLKGFRIIYPIILISLLFGFMAFVINITLPPNNGFIYQDGVSPFLWFIYQKTGLNIHQLVPHFYPKQIITPLHLFWIIGLAGITFLLYRLRVFSKEK